MLVEECEFQRDIYLVGVFQAPRYSQVPLSFESWIAFVIFTDRVEISNLYWNDWEMFRDGICFYVIEIVQTFLKQLPLHLNLYEFHGSLFMLPVAPSCRHSRFLIMQIAFLFFNNIVCCRSLQSFLISSLLHLFRASTALQVNYFPSLEPDQKIENILFSSEC